MEVTERAGVVCGGKAGGEECWSSAVTSSEHACIVVRRPSSFVGPGGD